MIRSWILKVVKKTKLYQALRRDIIDGANFKWDQFYDKADQYMGFIKDVDAGNREILSLLGDQVCIASDVHFKSNSVIIILSRLGNGQVRFIDARFQSLRELNHHIDFLKKTYQVPEERIFIDYPGNRRVRF